ncbi:hypothetical protein [Pseudomonas sp. DP-17]|uniref:hypothetical protein n=1 Tax=Pseudomonas sp. DP-17 TaxID=1580486 RepID=UPI001EFBC7E7|nr:hypothetical protein [Pseudomonas sp. DP-17]MCG8906728.1 hypothetical protein [Pseudomonas sp. DP-17]
MEKPPRRRWSPLWLLIVVASYLPLGSGGVMLAVSACTLLMSIPTRFISTIRRDDS